MLEVYLLIWKDFPQVTLIEKSTYGTVCIVL